jgi:hypothetical protein
MTISKSFEIPIVSTTSDNPQTYNITVIFRAKSESDIPSSFALSSDKNDIDWFWPGETHPKGGLYDRLYRWYRKLRYCRTTDVQSFRITWINESELSIFTFNGWNGEPYDGAGFFGTTKHVGVGYTHFPHTFFVDVKTWTHTFECSIN